MQLRSNRTLLATLFLFGAVPIVLAQGPPPPDGPPGGFMHRPPMERAFQEGHPGRWWDEPRLAQNVGLTDDQKHRMDDIFQQHRLKLIDLNANLQKQETIMQPLIEADQPDEAKIFSQIDAVAQARAELEKANARMLFDLRKVLTPDQWKKLQALRAEHRSEPEGSGREERWRDRKPGGSPAPAANGAAPTNGAELSPPFPGPDAPAGTR